MLLQLVGEWLGDDAPPDPVGDHVLPPEEYAHLMDDLGFIRQHVCPQVYSHRLADGADVVEWVRGISLRRFSTVLSPDELTHFVNEYRRRLVAQVGERRPYRSLFKRILMWGRLPGASGIA